MGAAVRAAGVEVLRIEIQVQAVDAARGGRPAAPVVADVHRCARVCDAVARGGARLSRLFREAPQLKTVATAARVAGIEVRHAEMQAHPIAAAHRRRIAEPAAADAAQPAIGSLAEARGGVRLFLCFYPYSRLFGLSPPRGASPLGDEAGSPVNRKSIVYSSSARPSRAADASPSPRTAIPLGIALFALVRE